MFKLKFFTTSEAAAIVKMIDRGDADEAARAAKSLIAEEFGQPGAYVRLDPSGSFSVGAGFRVRTGRYSLERADAFDPQA